MFAIQIKYADQPWEYCSSAQPRTFWEAHTEIVRRLMNYPSNRVCFSYRVVPFVTARSFAE